MKYVKKFESFVQEFDFDFKVDCYGNIEEVMSEEDNEDTCEFILQYLIDIEIIKLGHYYTYSRGNICIKNEIIKLNYGIEEEYYDENEEFIQDTKERINNKLLMDDDLKIMLLARQYNL